MASESRIVSTHVALGSDPAQIEVRYGVLPGSPYAVLDLGGGLTVNVSEASPEVLERLAAAALELADWKRQTTRLAVAS